MDSYKCITPSPNHHPQFQHHTVVFLFLTINQGTWLLFVDVRSQALSMGPVSSMTPLLQSWLV
jgi:hypothetical protein